MIPQETVNKILDTAQIVDVISDFQDIPAFSIKRSDPILSLRR